MPTDVDKRRLRGMASKIRFRTPASAKMKKQREERKTTPKAVCHGTPAA
jgi:hypothetical protein